MLLYLCVPQLLLATGATFLNLSLLTSDFFAVAIGTLLFGDEVPDIYAAAFACTVGGLVVFHLSQLSNAPNSCTIDPACVVLLSLSDRSRNEVNFAHDSMWTALIIAFTHLRTRSMLRAVVWWRWRQRWRCPSR